MLAVPGPWVNQAWTAAQSLFFLVHICRKYYTCSAATAMPATTHGLEPAASELESKFLREGWRGRLREARCAQALRGCVVEVLLAVPRGRPRDGEELVQVPVALRS